MPTAGTRRCLEKAQGELLLSEVFLLSILLQLHCLARPVLRWHCLITDWTIRWLDGCGARLEMAIYVTAWEEGQMSSQESREKWRTAFHSPGARAISADTESQVIYRNPVAEMLAGWVSGESWDKMAEEVFLITNAHTRESS
ncbi:MAG TPA: hypothetical protein PKZ70_07930 [Candidatus Atribacteria bacterium]|nr:hypothetical protein [Candidatus Atribacteria bacterium]